MKKLFSLVLSLVLVLSVCTAAFASTPEPKYDVQPTISKTYQVNNGTAPGERFNFSFEGVSYTNTAGEVVSKPSIPNIEDVSILFDATSETTTKTTTLDIDPADYQLGVYKYRVTEDAGYEAGVIYNTYEYYLVLTIVRDDNSNKHFVSAFHYESLTGEKKDEAGYINTYDSGKLTVTKHIAGNMADMDKKFTFTITFNPGEKTWDKNTADITGNGTWGVDSNTYTVELGNGDSVVFDNLPAGVTYTVTENKENYTLSDETYSDTTKTISANDEDTVDFTNTLTNRIDTGISMDSMPYILMLAAAVAGMVVFFAKKRSHNA